MQMLSRAMSNNMSIGNGIVEFKNGYQGLGMQNGLGLGMQNGLGMGMQNGLSS